MAGNLGCGIGQIPHDTSQRNIASMNRCYSRSCDFVARWIAGQTILVPVSANVAQLESIYTLNEMGTLIWGLIDGRTPLDKITEAVTAEYDVAAEEAAKDVLQFLDSLEEAGLICSSSGAGG